MIKTFFDVKLHLMLKDVFFDVFLIVLSPIISNFWEVPFCCVAFSLFFFFFFFFFFFCFLFCFVLFCFVLFFSLVLALHVMRFMFS